MKRLMVVAVVVAMGLAGTLVYGQSSAPAAPSAQVDVNAFRQFQKETLPLRDEMAVKRLELRNEFAKANPDQNRIAQLQKEMIDLRTKISAAAEKNGVAAYGPGLRGGAGYAGGGRGGAGLGCPQGAGYGYRGRMAGNAPCDGPGYGAGYGGCR